MKYSHLIHKPAFLVAGAMLLTVLAGCATPATQSDAVAEKPAMSMADKTAMKAECQAMHEKMMARKTEGDMQAHKMKTPEMMKKPQACMEMMPEMKAKMQEKCAAHKAGTMDHDKMGEGMMGHDKMEQHCAMMQFNDVDGAEQ